MPAAARRRGSRAAPAARGGRSRAAPRSTWPAARARRGPGAHRARGRPRRASNRSARRAPGTGTPSGRRASRTATPTFAGASSPPPSSLRAVAQRVVRLPVVHAGVAQAHVVRHAHGDLARALAAAAVHGHERDHVDAAVPRVLRVAGALAPDIRLAVLDITVRTRLAVAVRVQRLVL